MTWKPLKTGIIFAQKWGTEIYIKSIVTFSITAKKSFLLPSFNNVCVLTVTVNYGKLVTKPVKENEVYHHRRRNYIAMVVQNILTTTVCTILEYKCFPFSKTSYVTSSTKGWQVSLRKTCLIKEVRHYIKWILFERVKDSKSSWKSLPGLF